MKRSDVFELAERFERYGQTGAAAILKRCADDPDFDISGTTTIYLFDCLKHLAEKSWYSIGCPM
jgi:hypothetical protein